MAKEIEIVLSEEAKKELRDLKKKLKCSEIECLCHNEEEDKPLKALFG